VSVLYLCEKPSQAADLAKVLGDPRSADGGMPFMRCISSILEYFKGIKLTAQVKLQPTPEQSDALLRTLEMVNAACNRLSELAWEAGEFSQYSLHKLFYRQIRNEFPLSAQVVVRLNAKVADAYKIDQKTRREFRKHGSISYDLRILSWNMDKQLANVWTLDGRQKIPFVCGDHHRQLLGFQRGETDLVYRDKEWFLFTSVNVPDSEERKVLEWLGVDMGLVSIAQTSDGTRFGGSHLNGRRARNARLRRKLQKKGTKAAKRLMRRRHRRERRFAADVNHQISKKIVGVAQRTGRGISMEHLKGIRGRVRASKKQRRSLHSWSFNQLQGFIAYKAKRAGVPVVFVDARNTSRTCVECGHVDKRNRKSQAVFCCTACGHTDNADYNAAREISRRATVNSPNVAGVDVSSEMHNRVAKPSLVISRLL
jgi:putative transposase